MKDSKLVRVAAASCFHCPNQSPAAMEGLLRELHEFRPRVFINLGDLFEAEAASVHPVDEPHDVTQEYVAAAETLESIREVVGEGCSLIWLLGNHDDNLQAPDPRRVPKALRKSVHWNRDYDHGDTFRRWQQVPYEKSRRGLVEVGQIIFGHGYDCAANSDFTEAVQFSNLCGGYSHRLVVRGHTHRPRSPQPVMYNSRIPLPIWTCNVGTMGPTKPGYMTRKDSSQWGPAVLLAEVAVADPSTLQGDREWAAELIHL